MPDEALGLLYDSTLCIGCKACVSACKEANDMPPEFSTEDHLWDTPLDISGKTLNVIKVYQNGTAENKDSEEDGFAFMKVSCLHCADPSCVSACPVSAMTKDPVTGIVGYNKDACIGCRYCVAACPFGVPRFQYDKAIPQISKCQLCRHRMPDGKYAACAQVCPTGATLYGKAKDLHAEAQAPSGPEAGRVCDVPARQHQHARPVFAHGQGGEICSAYLRREGSRRHPDAEACGRAVRQAGHADLAGPVVCVQVRNTATHTLRRR